MFGAGETRLTILNFFQGELPLLWENHGYLGVVINMFRNTALESLFSSLSFQSKGLRDWPEVLWPVELKPIQEMAQRKGAERKCCRMNSAQCLVSKT